MAKLRCELAEERRLKILSDLRAFHDEEFDEALSPFQAERLLDFFLKALGPPVYNQAVQDARKFMLEKLDDMDSDLRDLEIEFRPGD